MRKWVTAFVWIVIVALGTGASEFYKTLRHPKKMDEFVTEYDQAWANALKDVSKTAPPKADDYIKITKAPLAYHTALRKKFAEISEGNQKEYDHKTAQMLDELEVKFNGKWEDAIEEGADSPPVDAMVKSVPEYHQEKLKKRLESANETMNNKHPRIKLALDSFSGYCVFRSREFLGKLSAQNIKLQLVDDDAVYKKRIEKLQSGEMPLAVFTIDALINNSAGAKTKDDEPPGKIVMVIDESVGADAMIGYEKNLPDLNALKQSGVKIVFTRDSPSETLARLVRASMPAELRDSLVPKDSVEEVYELAKTNPAQPQAFILWEPYVTRLMKERSRARVLIDSANAKSRGYFVDVLVVQKVFLEKHRKDRVEPIVRAYLEALNIHRQKGSTGMLDLVLADSKKLVDAQKLKDPLSAEEAAAVVNKIQWRSFAYNCGHFGLPVSGAAAQVEPMKAMIAKINALLVNSRSISKTWDHEESFFDPAICQNLLSAKFPTDEPPVFQPVAGQKVEPLTFRRGSDALSEESEEILKDVAMRLKKEPAYFLEIRGHMLGDTDADRELAQKRADAASRWLRDSGGVAADRLKIQIQAKSTEHAGAGVTMVVVQP